MSKEEPTWRDFALCRGMNPNIFFPGSYNTVAVNKAKAICAQCPVRLACEHYGVTHFERFGIWGGYTQRQLRTRRKLWKNREVSGVSIR
jgi:WhiB family redox-sensing transcriptional regulator